jgi:hypothetical protein
VRLRRTLGAALTVPVLVGALLLLTAGPAVACTCSTPRTDAERAARHDAVFVGQLVSSTDWVDQQARDLMRSSKPSEVFQGFKSDSSRVVWIFEVGRVYRGAVGKRQAIVTPTPSGGTCGRKTVLFHGPGPFLVFASWPSAEAARKYQLEPGQYLSDVSMCASSRPLADGGEPALGPSGGRPGRPDRWPSPASLAVGVGVLVGGVAVGLGLAALRARHQASAD